MFSHDLSVHDVDEGMKECMLATAEYTSLLGAIYFLVLFVDPTVIRFVSSRFATGLLTRSLRHVGVSYV